jgi:glycosyltransferase involved in cell wall biosynthesis
VRIAINAALAGPTATGIGTYASSLARALPRVDGGAHHYDVFVGGLSDADDAATAEQRLHWHTVPRGGAAQRLLWENWRFGRAAAAAHAAVLHSTSSYLPWSARGASVMTVHDLAIYRYPAAFKPVNRTLGRWLFERSLRRAGALIAPSQATCRDLVELLGVDAGRIQVIPEATDALFQPVIDPTELARVRHLYHLDRPYVLSVGTAEPRKNLVRLLTAFAACQATLPVTHELVLVGGRGWLTGPLEAAARPLLAAGLLRVLGYVPQTDLPALYSGAAAFAYPSIYEGFGLPVLEALACGAPVLTSNRSSLPEVVGTAGLLVDPDASAAIAAGLCALVTDAALATNLRRRGLSRARQFSWEMAARATLAVYARVLSSPVRAHRTADPAVAGERSG